MLTSDTLLYLDMENTYHYIKVMINGCQFFLTKVLPTFRPLVRLFNWLSRRKVYIPICITYLWHFKNEDNNGGSDGMKPDKDEDTKLGKLARQIRFNTIDTKLPVKRLIYFKIDVKQDEFMTNFCKQFGFTMSEAGRFCVDIVRAMNEGGLLEEFIREFSKFKEQRKI